MLRVSAALFASLVVSLAGCRAARGPSTPASAGVRDYISALRSPDPHGAYGLLSSDARKKTSFDEFALLWKQTDKERAWQATALEASVSIIPDVGERALVTYADGKIVHLERENKRWLLESELITRSHARRPRDAIQLFADAIAQRDVTRILSILTQRRRDGIQRQIEGFIAGIGKKTNQKLEESGDKAELRWDENGIRYRIVLRKESDEWRVDDIYARPAPKEEPTTPDETFDDE
ncbi:MAG: hypothetical protein NT062_07515 [Proteobacteria bacterium]|nr:hypothetical protein [Pseudomonadota bacterium]